MKPGKYPPQYLLRPVRSFGAAARLHDFFAGERSREADSAATVDGIVDDVRIELLRFEPTLSYHP